MSQASGPALIFLLFLAASSCGQSPPTNTYKYVVDSTVAAQVENKIKRFNGKANATIQIRLLESTSDDTALPKDIIPALVFSKNIEGATNINCTNGVEDGIGYNLIFYRDSCYCKFQAFSFIPANSLLFALNDHDMPVPEIFVPCKYYEVITSKGPSFKEGDIISGRVKLMSERFYEYKNGKKRKLRATLLSYFKSEPLPITNKQYKVLQKE